MAYHLTKRDGAKITGVYEAATTKDGKLISSRTYCLVVKFEDLKNGPLRVPFSKLKVIRKGSAGSRIELAVEIEFKPKMHRDALRQKRANWQCVGNISYEFRLAGDRTSVEEAPAEQATLADIRRSGARSMRKIAVALNDDGYRT